MIGFDFDGVVTTGRYKPDFTDVIITGNTIPMFAHVIKEMKRLGVACPVYFMPYDSANNIQVAAKWKSEMIERLNCSRFYEDDPNQAFIIKKNCPNCEVVVVR